MIKRHLKKQVTHWLENGKIVAIYGPRQVGKTTLAKEILSEYKGKGAFFDCEEFVIRNILESQKISEIERLFGDNKFIVLDEAQKVINIGLTLKIFYDAHPEIKIIATGSSSFDLSNKINEPLTGRMISFTLYPISFLEYKDFAGYSQTLGNMNSFLIYGGYPERFKRTNEDIPTLLKQISINYLYKDIFDHEEIKKPELLNKILLYLALQLGNEVSVNKIASKLEVSKTLIGRYIELLEKTFVVFKLSGFSRAKRNEVNQNKKYYFYDLGIRNALINNFNPLLHRDDVGALWENFLIVERLKYLTYNDKNANIFFWRNFAMAEVDYIEERDGEIYAYEFKWQKPKIIRFPKAFINSYNPKIFLISPENFVDFAEGKI